MSVELAAASYLLSSLSSVGKILESIFKLREYKITPTPEQFDEIERAASANAEPVSVPDKILLASTATEEIIDVLTGQIDKIKEQIKDTYRSRGMTEVNKNAQLDVSRRDFCWTLHQIAQHNSGKLPDHLQNDWSLNLCSSYRFI